MYVLAVKIIYNPVLLPHAVQTMVILYLDLSISGLGLLFSITVTIYIIQLKLLTCACNIAILDCYI